MKKCITCGEEKDLFLFQKRKDSKDGYRNECKDCKECCNIRAKKYREYEDRSEYQKQHYLKNKERINKRHKKHYENNKEMYRERDRRYYKNNKKKICKRKQYRYHNDISYRMTDICRGRVYKALKGLDKSEKTDEIVGGIDLLISHLESLFTEDMTWENYGTYWEVDHIKPCCMFDLTNEKELKECFNYKNCQPLTCSENRSKGGLYED